MTTNDTTKDDPQVTPVKKRCKECGCEYDADEELENALPYLDHPCDYETGIRSHCLACWLGVGPKDLPNTEGPPAGDGSYSHALTYQMSPQEKAKAVLRLGEQLQRANDDCFF